MLESYVAYKGAVSNTRMSRAMEVLIIKALVVDSPSRASTGAISAGVDVFRFNTTCGMLGALVVRSPQPVSCLLDFVSAV